MGKGSAPKPDPKIGEAALLSAQTGEKYLEMMRKQSDISNEWAAVDRQRQQDTFVPLQDDYIEKATTWGSEARQNEAAITAGATVQGQMQMQRDAAQRQQAAMGVNPASGRGIEFSRRGANDTALAVAGGRNTARRGVQDQSMQMLASAVNLGQGLEVNPGTSLGLANNSLNSGFQGAMSGYNQQGSLLGKQYDQQMQAWQAKQQAGSSFWGGVGTLVGAFASDEEIKSNKTPPKKSPRRSIDRMRVEEWDYNPGEGDGKRHIGTYAQDFQKETGFGDGRSIDVIDAIGVTMGATKEISRDLDALVKEVSALKAMKGDGAPRGRSI